MYNYDIFRKKSNSTKCSDRIKSNLITNSAGTTQVLHRRVNKDIEVNLVITNKTEGRGTAKVYTWAADDLQVGDYFVWKNKYVFLVTEQENNVLLDGTINKFAARECNVIVYFENQLKDTTETKLNDSIDAVFIGTSTSKVLDALKTRDGSSAVMTFSNNDLIIFSGTNFERLKQLVIKNQQWDVVDWDSVTASPIIYATIKPVAVTLIDKEPIIPEQVIYRSGLTYDFLTEDYYFSTEDNIKYERMKDKISITIPYNVPSISFKTKQNGTIIDHTIEIA